MSLSRLILTCGVLTSLVVFSGEPAKPAPKKPGDRKAIETDYGPAMAITVGITKDNIAYKGILIPLNKERTLNVLFDTELCRVAGVWSGGFLNWASRNYADNNNDYCTADGKIEFATSPLPGWSHDGKRDDPRNPKDGPLPREWAKYKGLYLNGDQVVISYTVGGVDVLESYQGVEHSMRCDFTRILEIGPSKQPMEMFMFESELVEKKFPPEINPISGLISFHGKDARTSGTIYDPPEGEFDSGGVNPSERLRQFVSWGPASAMGASNATQARIKIAPHDDTLFFRIKLRKDDNAVTGGFGEYVKKVVKLSELTHGGPARWTQPVTTKGTLAKDDAPYVVDTLTVPEENPYKSWMRLTGLDFFPDGRAAVCTWNGDVWIVSGIDDKLEALKWKRFATGLNNPMGIKIIDGVIYTIGRDQITKLHDLNNDGEADFYENINNDCYLTTNFHEMCFDLQTDKDGNFYFTKGSSIWAGEQRMTPHNGTVVKVSKDGSKFETICNGLRAPNGLAIGPNGEITVSDNQGNWIPSCPINLIKKDGYYGWVGKGQKESDFKTPDKPLCWIPYNMDKSSSGMVWVPKDDTKWGPLANRLLLASYDCWLTLVFFDDIAGDMQGGTFRFPLKFASGMMRPRFNPIDGQLYVAGLKGWSSSASRDGALQRVRYTGKPAVIPVETHLNKNGFEINFSGALDAASVSDKQNWSAEWFNVVRTANYGSPEFSITDPKKKAREPIDIAEIKLKQDGKTIALTIPKLQPVTNIVIKFKIKAADGSDVKGEVDYTINRMP